MRPQGVFFSLCIALFFGIASIAIGAPACTFLNDPADFAVSQNSKSVLLDQYFRIYYSPGDPFFQDTDRNDIPDVLDRQIGVIQRSRYFLQTELGWDLP